MLAPPCGVDVPCAVDLLARPRLWRDACDAIKRTCQEGALRALAESWGLDAQCIVSTGLRRSWIGRAFGGSCLGAVPPGMPLSTHSRAISGPLTAAHDAAAPPQAASLHESLPAALSPSESQQRQDSDALVECTASAAGYRPSCCGEHRRRPSHDAWLAQACLDALEDSRGAGDDGADITVATVAAAAAASPSLLLRQKGAAAGMDDATAAAASEAAASEAARPGWLKPAFFTAEWWERRRAARLGGGGGSTAQPGREILPRYERPRPPASDRSHWQHPLGASLPPLVLTASDPWF